MEGEMNLGREGRVMERTILYQCGPVDCNHDYQGCEDILSEDGKIIGGTAVCVKCGARAIDDAVWQ